LRSSLQGWSEGHNLKSAPQPQVVASMLEALRHQCPEMSLAPVELQGCDSIADYLCDGLVGCNDARIAARQKFSRRLSQALCNPVRAVHINPPV